ncbi:MAG TPA: TetR/AcrR family transcriptional regulator [Micromonosporaceae bacterium]|nr:TetR/AcrR family transcriptional regulator [Micromonosporaceae bacterium]
MREKVLRAAVASLARDGFSRTTARSIAAQGGFAPGVIYYYFADLDALHVAAMEFTSREREERYRESTLGLPNAVTLVKRLRDLYAEDAGSGHIEAIQELISAARPGTPLAAAVAEHTRRWEAFAEEVIASLLRGSPLARLVKPAVAARTAVAYYLGLQTLTYLDGDATRPEAAFAQAARLAAAYDKLPRLGRGRKATVPLVKRDGQRAQ